MKAKKNRDKARRSAVKSATFRVVVVLADTVIIYALTHRFDLTIGVLVATNVASTVLYYLHERIWNKISWGKTS